MRLSTFALTAALVSTPFTTALESSFKQKLAHRSLVSLESRDPTGNFDQLYLASNYQNGSTAPGAAANDNAGQQVVVGGTGADDDSQRPGCDTIFINTAAVNGSDTGGWTEIPNVLGFYVDRNITYGTATMPVFVEANKDLTKVKRVIIGQPGKPRDAWKYSNLFRNSLNCAVANTSMAVQWNDVLVTAPVWLDMDDHNAGAGNPTDLYFSDGGWNQGSKAQGPGNADASSFEVLDSLVTRFANQSEFPALTSIIVAGHSLGGSVSQRYAMLRNNDSSTEALVSYWVGNPGAYVWPSPQRPVTPSNTSCASEVDDWSYGVAGGLPAYVKGKPAPDTFYARYRTRRIQYALGLADFGPGDTHCEAQYQGSSHLNRGQNMQKALQAMAGGMPSTQSFNYVPNTSHEDYLMMSDPNSQSYLFVEGLTDPRPSGTASSSSGGSSNSKSGSKSGSSSGGSNSLKSGAGVLESMQGLMLSIVFVVACIVL
ncbi:uncharacterized protein FA14DRAFT_161411 [Meira miltonrushii]|uniref:Alpha/beta-hydrolase n=1 Tax=Meira miltonrushii TaxID=1280837 RepID=A0A316V829_9BASI|nr:uncharacterized protein FA14DRAFT_161411 [Meira miltonrushii]PWN33676.1 hypothetical protein FA14DRAFT_161411 [Meira miltonrushii]